MILCLPALRPTPQNQPTLLTKCPAPIIIRVGALLQARRIRQKYCRDPIITLMKKWDFRDSRTPHVSPPCCWTPVRHTAHRS
jgi:hypothetical protein